MMIDNKYIFFPNNPNLKHCPDTILGALEAQGNDPTLIHPVAVADSKNIASLVWKVLTSTSDQSFTLFFLAVQPDYLILLGLLKFAAFFRARKVRAYYQMHEPRLNRGETSSFKAFIILVHQLLFGYLADVVSLPSYEAVMKAKAFVPIDKIHQINLTFSSVPRITLERQLRQLRASWEEHKTFLLLGTITSWKKNPQGFLNFASLFNQLYPDKAEFIRAGRDKNITVQYSEEIVRFSDFLSEQTKRFLLSLSHFIVIPYVVSTQSGVIAEAFSYGKLVIINDIPEFDHLKNLDFVYTVKFGDTDAMVDTIQSIMSMTFEDYESRYWSAIRYFQANHSETYLTGKLNELL